MKKACLLGAAIAALCAARPAHATVVDLFGQVQGGGMGGYGVAGQQKDADFFKDATAGAGGVVVGGKFFFLAGWIEHDQFFTSSIKGTWTQFLLGVDFRFKVGDTPEGQKQKNFGRISVGGGYGMGTPKQVDPPLNNAQISDKGFVGQFTFSMEHDFNRFMSFGAALPIEYGYLWKNDGTANDETKQYQSVHASALLFFRFHIEIK